MRYHVLATDYDGTLASHGSVDAAMLDKLRELKAGGRKLVLVTGREMKDLEVVFPDYAICDYIVAENGAVIYEPATGQEKLLGAPPDPAFIRSLEEKGVAPLSVGKVIVATWEPHEQQVLEVIKTSGSERQVIFNKGAVMILPPGVNKATGLHALLKSLNMSTHNTVAVGDAENDSALLQTAECAVAVGNALPSLKQSADWVTDSPSSRGVAELIDRLILYDLSAVNDRLIRHFLELGSLKDGSPFTISPYRSGILLSGASGSGKTTFTISIVESIIRQGYQFCLVDPEGDYLELPGAVVMGTETTLPTLEEIKALLTDPGQNLVICTLSVPLADRPAFFTQLLNVIAELRRQYGHPHWLLLDEAHHLLPAAAGIERADWPVDDNNFILISTSPHALSAATLSRVGMVIALGKDPAYPFEQFCKIVGVAMPSVPPSLAENEIWVWDRETDKAPFAAQYHLPAQLQQRHKKKYAQGEMGYNSFVFTGPENKMHLVANNLMLFIHLAEGIDTDTWTYHLQRGDFTRWFRNSVHDEDLAKVGEEAEGLPEPADSKQKIISFIAQKYTA